MSYSRLDDAVPPDLPESSGFVSSLFNRLQYEFGVRGDPRPEVWRDSDHAGADHIPTHTKDAIAASSLLLVILSRNWLGSRHCRLELDAFAERGGADLRERIVVVRKRHVELNDMPILLQGQEGFRFYTLGDRGDLTNEYEFFSRGEIRDQIRYVKVVSEIADYLWRRAGTLSKKGRLLPPSPPIVEYPKSAAETGKAPETVSSRETPEYWLRRVTVERKLSPGDEPLVLVSFASEDQLWIDELHAFLEPRLDQLRDIDQRPYQLWNFSDAKRGTTPGDEFPEIVAEKMWRCRAAIIVFSRDYFRSQYCRRIELPFLMWRWEHHKLMCLPVKLGTVPIDKVKLPAYEGPSRSVVLDDIIDDRQAAISFAASQHRDLNLKELKESGLEAEIEKRFDGVGRRVVDFLKRRHGATDED
jgi:TIR domain